MWQTLTLEIKGTHFRMFLNGTRLFELDDAALQGAGKGGLWTKADGVTPFDDLTVHTDRTR